MHRPFSHSRIVMTLSLIVISILTPQMALSAMINAGDLVITEFLANPTAVSDSNGEWFEVFNRSTRILDLNGLHISDDGTDAHTVAHMTPLMLAPGDYFVFGRNADPALNGGYDVDYTYSSMTLSNSSDEIILSDNGIEIARIEYTGTTSGASTELVSLEPFPVGSGNYAVTPAAFQFGLGDRGTPGTAGSQSLTAASPVPIPSSVLLMGTGIIGLTLWKRRRLKP